MKGALYLIPSDLGGESLDVCLPLAVQEKLRSLNHFIVEDAKTARRFLASAGRTGLQGIQLRLLNKHTSSKDLPHLLSPLTEGKDVGLISEAGCPAVADPGADLVALAHRHGIRVVPMVGPSSILLTVMASGLTGQRFTFHGYLPVEHSARRDALIALEHASSQSDTTQIFIETPYRNNSLLKDILEVCRPDTRLCLASDLTLTAEFIATRSISDWQCSPPDLNRRPTVFALLAPANRSANESRRRHPSSEARKPRTRQPQNASPRVRRNSRVT